MADSGVVEWWMEYHPVDKNDVDLYELRKRTYLPSTIHATCPKCGDHVMRDFRECYLSYPTVGVATELELECEGPIGGRYCGSFAIQFRLDVTLSPITTEGESALNTLEDIEEEQEDIEEEQTRSRVSKKRVSKKIASKIEHPEIVAEHKIDKKLRPWLVKQARRWGVIKPYKMRVGALKLAIKKAQRAVEEESCREAICAPGQEEPDAA